MFVMCVVERERERDGRYKLRREIFSEAVTARGIGTMTDKLFHAYISCYHSVLMLKTPLCASAPILILYSILHIYENNSISGDVHVNMQNAVSTRWFKDRRCPFADVCVKISCIGLRLIGLC